MPKIRFNLCEYTISQEAQEQLRSTEHADTTVASVFTQTELCIIEIFLDISSKSLVKLDTGLLWGFTK